MKKLLLRLREAAHADPETVWFDTVSSADVEAAESYLGFELPTLLTRSFVHIGNGGFGPGPLIGLPGGHESAHGDLLQTWSALQDNDDCEEVWLPIIDWGGRQFSLIDCDDLQMITLYEGEFHIEDYTFDELLTRWLAGELPELHSGSFVRKEE